MFGHNIITGQKFFRDAPEACAGKLLVTSVFRTIQGEGPFAGMPAVFVRLTHCNLQCAWCDTYFDSGDWLSSDELLDKIDAARDGLNQDLLVVTGGEPTLQGNLGRFLEYALGTSVFKHAQIESNGLIRADVPDGTTVVVSPKCPERNDRSLEHYPRLPPASLLRADCLKFILSGDPGSVYYSIPDWAHEWRRQTGREIYISPMAEYNHVPGQTRALYDARSAPSLAERTLAERISFWAPNLLDMTKCRRNYEYAAEYVMGHGLRLSIQQHLFASLP